MKANSTIEHWYPYFIGAAAGVLFSIRVARHAQFTGAAMGGFFVAVLTVSSIAAGFLGTSLSVLYSIEDRGVVRDLVAAGVWPVMLRYVMTAIKWCFALAIISAAGMVAVDRMNPDHYPIALSAWSFIVFITALLCYRVISLFSRILASP